MKNANARTTRKAVAFDYNAYQSRLKGAIVAADNASAAIVATVIELRGHADEEKARELFKATYMAALAELRGVEADSLASDPVVQARVSDCLAIFRAPQLPEGMTLRSVQGAAKACREAAKAASGEAPADKAKRAPRQPTGKGDVVSVDDIAPLALVTMGLERLRTETADADLLDLIAEASDLIGELADALAKKAKPAKPTKRRA